MSGIEPLFIDTNILVYANVATAPLHRQALEAIDNAYQAGQVLGDFQSEVIKIKSLD